MYNTARAYCTITQDLLPIVVVQYHKAAHTIQWRSQNI